MLRLLVIEIAVVAVIFLALRMIRGKIKFFRKGYVVRRDSYLQNEKIWVVVEDTRFFRSKQNNFRSVRVAQSNVVYSRIPLDKNNKALMVYSYCAPLLGMLRGSGTPIRRTLTLGGGGGAVPLYVLASYDGSTADIVEYNADSVRVMRQHFLDDFVNGDAPRANIILADAREAVKTLEAPYQFIFCDLYVGGQPVDLTYDEAFMREISRLAGDAGMLVINGGSLNILGVRMMLHTLLKTFTHMWAMFLDREGFVLVAANREMSAMDNLLHHNHQLIPIYPTAMTKEGLLADLEGDAGAE